MMHTPLVLLSPQAAAESTARVSVATTRLLEARRPGRINQDGTSAPYCPWLHLDMEKLSVGEAAAHLRAWIALNRIEVLNVAGVRESKGPEIYNATLEVLQAVLL